MTKEQAIELVRSGEYQRVVMPKQWVVWREGDAVMARTIQPKGN